MVANQSAAIRFLLASRQCEINSLRYLLSRGELIGLLSTLIHQLQRERGAVTLYLCQQGQQTEADLYTSAQQSLILRHTLLDYLDKTVTDNNEHSRDSRLYSALARAICVLDSLPETRCQVNQQHISLVEAVSIFNDTIRHLLSLVFVLSDTESDTEISRALIALFSFMQGKELAGQERAMGVRVFSYPQDHHQPPATSAMMTALISRQEHCFATFLEFCDTKNTGKWQTLTPDGEFERLRRIACTTPQGSHRRTDLSQHWFNLATTRIDDYRRLEDSLQSELMDICQRKLTACEQAFNQQQADIDALRGTSEETYGSYSVFLGTCPTESGEDGWLQSGEIPPRLGHSLLSLLSQQSQRLDAQHQELESLRQVLSQRTMIDNAKKLVMTHRRISEDEAYKLLRQMAMDQNKKISEIAAAILSVAGVLHTPTAQ